MTLQDAVSKTAVIAAPDQVRGDNAFHDFVIAAPDQVRGDSALHDFVIAGLTRNPMNIVNQPFCEYLINSV
jgi:hypothetical protein